MFTHQDWESVVLKKKVSKADMPKELAAKSSQAPKQTSIGLDVKKLENAETFHHEHVNSELKQQIVKARLGLKMSQADLAKKINESQKLVQEYENGKAIPDNRVLQKMSKALGVTLKKHS